MSLHRVLTLPNLPKIAALTQIFALNGVSPLLPSQFPPRPDLDKTLTTHYILVCLYHLAVLAYVNPIPVFLTLRYSQTHAHNAI